LVDLQGNLAVDTSVWIEYFLGTAKGNQFLHYLKNSTSNQIYISLSTLAEVYYVICRIKGENLAQQTVQLLKSVKNLIIDNTETLTELGGSLKCKRAIALADCLNIALAQKYNCSALFAMKEAELKKEINRESFPVEIIFLTEE
jgi:predicted nucleic acid-binding protein